MISKLKITPDKEMVIIAKVLIKNIKEKNNNKWFELKLEDKSGTINALLFPKNNFNELNELIKENEVYKFKGKYSEKFKNFNIIEINNEVNKEEIEQNIRLKKEINFKNLKKEILNFRKEIKNKFMLFIYDILIKNDIDNIIKLPATAFKSFSYKGGLLQRNLEVLKQSLNLINIKELTDLNKDLLILGSLILDIGKKDTYIDETHINDLGQLIPNDIIVLEKVELLYLQWLEQNGIVITNTKKEIEELQSTIKKLKEKKEILKKEYIQVDKEIEKQQTTITFLNEEIKKSEEELNQIKEKIEVLKEKRQNKKIKEEISELEKQRKKIEEQYKELRNKLENENKLSKLQEQLENIVKEGKIIKETIEKNEKKVKELKNFVNEKKEYLKNIEILKNKLKHILLTNTYYITNKESNFPRFEEAQIIALTLNTVVNSEYFINEIKNLKESGENNNYSNKLNKYLFLK